MSNVPKTIRKVVTDVSKKTGVYDTGLGRFFTETSLNAAEFPDPVSGYNQFERQKRDEEAAAQAEQDAADERRRAAQAERDAEDAAAPGAAGSAGGVGSRRVIVGGLEDKNKRTKRSFFSRPSGSNA